MSDEPDKTNDRMEGLLRRWGADEAAEHAPQVTLPPPGRSAGAGVALRYGAVAAAALLVGMLATVLLERGVRYHAGAAAASSQPAEDEIRNLNADLTKAETDLARVKAELTALKGEELKLQAEVVRLQEECSGHKRAAIDAAALRRTVERQQERLAKLAAAEKQLAQARLDLDAARKTLKQTDAQRDEASRKLAAAAAELAGIGKSYKQAISARNALQGELRALKARQAAALADLQRVYLAAAAANERGIRARQWAGRRTRIVQRAAGVRSLAHSKLARQAVDRLEVVLIRLELLDVEDAEAVQAFAALLRAVRPPETVDQALAAGGEVAKVRAWLLEARLILTGAGRVG